MKIINRKINRNKTILVTESELSTDEAIQKKMKVLEPKILGKKLVAYKELNRRKVLVPYAMLFFDFDVNRNLLFKNNELFIQSGQICAIFDMNEMHTSIYDLNEGQIPFIEKNKRDYEGHILSKRYSENEMLENVKDTIERKVIKKAYKAEGHLNMTKSIHFYREAWELQLESNNKMFRRYAYLDIYSRGNERVKGIKARIGD